MVAPGQDPAATPDTAAPAALVPPAGSKRRSIANARKRANAADARAPGKRAARSTSKAGTKRKGAKPKKTGTKTGGGRKKAKPAKSGIRREAAPAKKAKAGAGKGGKRNRK